jgi:glycerol kinase
MLLDLKQKQASVLEADYARQETAETTSQGKTLLAFATVTIIFVCSDAPCDYCF